MRVQIGVQSLYSNPNPHYGYGVGGTRFIVLRAIIFSVTNSRDVFHVVDSLLHHETDINTEEHYTDTAGYAIKFLVYVTV